MNLPMTSPFFFCRGRSVTVISPITSHLLVHSLIREVYTDNGYRIDNFSTFYKCQILKKFHNYSFSLSDSYQDYLNPKVVLYLDFDQPLTSLSRRGKTAQQMDLLYFELIVIGSRYYNKFIAPRYCLKSSLGISRQLSYMVLHGNELVRIAWAVKRKDLPLCVIDYTK